MKGLLIGFGGIARKHLGALRTIAPTMELAAFRRTGKEKPNDIQRLFAQWEEVKVFQPDFALICSPTAFHLIDAKQVAELNISFLIEKPVASTMEGLPELCQILEKKQLITYVACQLRFDPLLEYVQSELSQGGYQRPQRVRIFCHSYLPSWRPGRDYREVYSSRRELGGGVAFDLIHEFDYAVWWFGLPSQVFGVRTKVSPLEILSDDQCNAILLYKGLVVEISLSYGERNEERGFELIYEDHSIHGDLLTGTLKRRKGSEELIEKTFARDRDSLFSRQMEHFLECLKAGRPTRNPFREGMDVLQIPLQLKSVFYE